MRRSTSLAAHAGAALLLAPLCWLVIAAFRSEDDILANPYGLPRHLTFANFRELLSIPAFVHGIGNSLLIATATASVVTVIAAPLGYVVSRYTFFGARLLRSIGSAGYLLAPAVLVFPYTDLLSRLGLMNSRVAIVLAHAAFAMPFAFGIAELGARGIPFELEEAAILDGATPVQRVMRVVLPLLRFQLAGLFTLVFCVSWKEYFYAFTIAQTEEVMTLPVLLGNLHGGDALSWNLVCALSVVLLLPAVPVLLLTRSSRLRELARGRHD